MLVKDWVELSEAKKERAHIDRYRAFYCGDRIKFLDRHITGTVNILAKEYLDRYLEFDIPEDFGDVEINIDDMKHFAFFKGSKIKYLEKYFRTFKGK